MEEEICSDTGLAREDCPCMRCQPPMFFFKFMLVNYQIENIDDVIQGLKDKLAFFKKLKDDGFMLSGPVDDHYAAFEPPDSDDYYWAQCRSSGCYLKLPSGEAPLQMCPTCEKNLYEYEG